MHYVEVELWLFLIPYLAAFAAGEYCPPPGTTAGTPPAPPVPPSPPGSPPPGPPETHFSSKWRI